MGTVCHAVSHREGAETSSCIRPPGRAHANMVLVVEYIDGYSYQVDHQGCKEDGGSNALPWRATFAPCRKFHATLATDLPKRKNHTIILGFI